MPVLVIINIKVWKKYITTKKGYTLKSSLIIERLQNAQGINLNCKKNWRH